MAAKANIVVDQGSTFTTTLNLSDDNDNPIDLNGYEVYAQIRKWFTSTTFVEFTTDVPDASGGVITLSLSAETTANMEYGRYVYDAVIVLPNANLVTRVVEGILTVTPEVTQL